MEKILVIDDDEKIISMLQRGLKFSGYEVVSARNGEEGLLRFAEEAPDLVILDVMMPKMDGWAVCKKIREVEQNIPILMLTAKDEVVDRIKGLDLGADDYLIKPFALEELFARVRALLRRKAEDTSSASILEFEDLTMRLDFHEVSRQGHKIELTAKEFELLTLFMRHPKRVFSKEELMEKIWGYDYVGESNVLEVYIAMLRQKLEEKGAPRLIYTIRGAGYVLRGED